MKYLQASCLDKRDLQNIHRDLYDLHGLDRDLYGLCHARNENIPW